MNQNNLCFYFRHVKSDKATEPERKRQTRVCDGKALSKDNCCCLLPACAKKDRQADPFLSISLYMLWSLAPKSFLISAIMRRKALQSVPVHWEVGGGSHCKSELTFMPIPMEKSL